MGVGVGVGVRYPRYILFLLGANISALNNNNKFVKKERAERSLPGSSKNKLKEGLEYLHNYIEAPSIVFFVEASLIEFEGFNGQKSRC